MAVGTQFLTIYTNLRAEVRRSTSVSVGVEDLPYLKRVVNHVYRALTLDYEWPHLRVAPTRIWMAAGQNLYDFPSELDFDGVTEAVCWNGGANSPIESGITLADYSVLDPDSDNRQDPVLKYDLRFSETKVQFEVWPLPATNDAVAVQFKGNRKLAALVNDTDKLWLDDELVQLFAAAEVLKADKADDAESKLQLAQDYLRRLKVRGKANSKRYAMGLGTGGGRSITGGVQINITPSGA